MKRTRTAAALCAAAATVGMLGAGVGTAVADGNQPLIIGGDKAPQVKWGAQVYVNTPGKDYEGFNCSGTIIAPQWVLTAQHCLDEDNSGMRVKVGSNELLKGQEAKVDKKEVAPKGDIALLHLDKAVQTDYMGLADAAPKEGATNQIYGWGREQGQSPPAQQLKTANVQVTGKGTDAFGGEAIASKGVNGASWHGDSGGPQVADGKQAGVCSTGENDGSDPHGSQNYASVAASRDWIKKTAGV